MHGNAACSRGRVRGGARGSLCCRSVWVCKLLGLGPADLYHRAAINAPSINAWLPAHQQGLGVIQKMYPRGFPSATGERSRARGRADLLSSPRGTVPTAGWMCLGTARSERGQEQGDSSAVPAQTHQTSLFSLTLVLHTPASSLKLGACACLLQILREQQPQLPLPWMGGAHGIAWHRVASCGIAEPHQGLSQAAEAPQPVPAPPAHRGDVGQLLQPPLAQRGRASARSTLGWVGRRGECSQHKHSIILPFFLLCLLC